MSGEGKGNGKEVKESKVSEEIVGVVNKNGLDREQKVV